MRTSILRRLPSGLFAPLLAVLLLATACDSTDPSDDPGAGEAEVISDVIVSLADANDAVVTSTARFDEQGVLDPDAPAALLTLAPGMTYTGEIVFRNRFASNPAEEDVTAEVRAEAREHQVFHVVAPAELGTLTVLDVETDYSADAGDPSQLRDDVTVGLRFELAVSASASGTGSLRIVLGHYDEGKGTDERLGADTEIDVDATFPLAIQ